MLLSRSWDHVGSPPQYDRRARAIRGKEIDMNEDPRPIDAPLPPGMVDAGAYVTPAAIIAFTEGPAVDRDGTVYFSDMRNNRIMKLAPSGELSVFRSEAGRANGNLFDREGRLVTCEGAEQGPGGGRRITRTDLRTGAIEILTDRYDGQRYNSPNDLAVDTRGRIYFTDPRYSDSAGRDQDAEAVYRLDPSGTVTRIVSQPEVQKPNGIAVTPDDRTLYLVDSNPVPGGNKKIWAFDLDPDGAVSNQRLVYDFAPGRGGDGLRVDREGNIWVAAGVVFRGYPGVTLDVPAGIYVITPKGRLVGRIPIPEDLLTNLTYGPPDGKTLYVTAGATLYRIPINVSGYVLHL
jgi:gluconolactonase